MKLYLPCMGVVYRQDQKQLAMTSANRVTRQLVAYQKRESHSTDFDGVEQYPNVLECRHQVGICLLFLLQWVLKYKIYQLF